MRDDRIKIINRQSGEVTVTLPYNPVHIEKLKEIEEHKWNPEEKCPKDPYGLGVSSF